MNRSSIRLWLTLALACASTAAQDLHHSSSFTLAERYEKLSCSVVRLVAGADSGTGFFISANGDLVTAAHVVFDKVFSIAENGQVRITITRKPGLRIANGVGIGLSDIPLAPLSELDAERAAQDIALLRTGLIPDCHVEIGDSGILKVGQHLIAIGYPANLTSSAALYNGFLSASDRRIGPVAMAAPGQAVVSHDPFLRIQMPITAGASGSPIIDDDDRAVGVVSGMPVPWLSGEEAILRNFISSPSTRPDVLPNGSLDLERILGELVWIVHDYESPGIALAIPMNYLRVPPSRTSTKVTPRRRSARSGH